MKKVIPLLICVCSLSVNAADWKPELRIQISNTNIFKCVIQNTTAIPLQIPSLFPGRHNRLLFTELLDARRNKHQLGGIRDISEVSEPITLLSGEIYLKYISAEYLYAFTGFSEAYYNFHWMMDNHVSQVITIGTVISGQLLPPPVVAEKSIDVELLLAYIYNKDAPSSPELGFLVFNGTNVPVTVTQPLFNDNRLIVTVPSINYSNEIFTVSNTATNATVEAREVA